MKLRLYELCSDTLHTMCMHIWEYKGMLSVSSNTFHPFSPNSNLLELRLSKLSDSVFEVECINIQASPHSYPSPLLPPSPSFLSPVLLTLMSPSLTFHG